MARKPANPTRIQKSGTGHQYFLDGKKVPGVTTILSRGLPKPALQAWAARMTASFVVNRLTARENDDGTTTIVADDVVSGAKKINQESKYPKRFSGDALDRIALEQVLTGVRFADRDEAARRGTEVHNIAEKIAAGEEVEIPEPIAGHVAAYEAFLDEWQPRDALLEFVVVNKTWGYMGKGDMIASFDHMAWPAGHPRAGEPMGRGLLDIKTSRSGIFPDVALQLEGYANAEFMLDPDDDTALVPMESVDFIAAIHVRADGYDVYTFDRGPDNDGAESFRIFLYAAEVGHWLEHDDGGSKTIKSDALAAPTPIGGDQ